MKWKTTHASLFLQRQGKYNFFFFLTCCDIRLDAFLQIVPAAFCFWRLKAYSAAAGVMSCRISYQVTVGILCTNDPHFLPRKVAPLVTGQHHSRTGWKCESALNVSRPHRVTVSDRRTLELQLMNMNCFICSLTSRWCKILLTGLYNKDSWIYFILFLELLHNVISKINHWSQWWWAKRKDIFCIFWDAGMFTLKGFDTQSWCRESAVKAQMQVFLATNHSDSVLGCQVYFFVERLVRCECGP